MKLTTKPLLLRLMQDNIVFLGFADNKMPEFKEVKSKDWILYGEDNKFPQQLLYLYNKSSNHNAIINGKVIYIFGKGFEQGNVQVNPMGETYNKVFKKFIHDIEIFGGGRLEVLWLMGGKAELRHIPFHYLRRAKEKNGYWYSKNWEKYTQPEFRPVFVPDFDDKNKKGAQILAYNEYRPGVEEYPLPGYFGALNDIETDVEISKYNLSIIKNGMFASKMIVFNNGEPTKETKQKIERDFKNKFAGSENSGNFMLVFNTDPAKAPIINDLSTTDLDKLFDQLNKTTQSEIFSAHLVTSPMLFGIKTEGQLGGRSEIVEAYEIFKNTYINDKQQAIEEVDKMLAPLVGVTSSKIIPVEPISEKLNAIDFKDMLPEAWVFEQLGIDPTKYQPAQPVQPTMQNAVNENLKNLTGRQFQQLTRVLNRFRKGKIQRQEAELLLRDSYGLNPEDISELLSEQTFSKMTFSIKIPDADLIKLLSDFFGDEFTNASDRKRRQFIDNYRKAESDQNEQIKKYGSVEKWYLSGEGRSFLFSQDEEDVSVFSEFGDAKSNYTVVKSMRFDGDFTGEYMAFADLSQVDSNILNMIKKDKRIDPKDIAAAVNSSPEYVSKRLDEMLKEGVLTQTSKVQGIDTIIERAVNPEVIDYRPKPQTVDVYVKYTYEKRPEAKGAEIIDTTRPFCKRLIELDRVYTRSEIETVSQRLGYSVFDRAGGFWGHKPQCRHEWRRLLVIKKK